MKKIVKFVTLEQVLYHLTVSVKSMLCIVPASLIYAPLDISQNVYTVHDSCQFTIDHLAWLAKIKLKIKNVIAKRKHVQQI